MARRSTTGSWFNGVFRLLFMYAPYLFALFVLTMIEASDIVAGQAEPRLDVIDLEVPEHKMCLMKALTKQGGVSLQKIGGEEVFLPNIGSSSVMAVADGPFIGGALYYHEDASSEIITLQGDSSLNTTCLFWPLSVPRELSLPVDQLKQYLQRKEGLKLMPEDVGGYWETDTGVFSSRSNTGQTISFNAARFVIDFYKVTHQFAVDQLESRDITLEDSHCESYQHARATYLARQKALLEAYATRVTNTNQRVVLSLPLDIGLAFSDRLNELCGQVTSSKRARVIFKWSLLWRDCAEAGYRLYCSHNKRKPLLPLITRQTFLPKLSAGEAVCQVQYMPKNGGYLSLNYGNILKRVAWPYGSVEFSPAGLNKVFIGTSESDFGFVGVDGEGKKRCMDYPISLLSRDAGSVPGLKTNPALIKRFTSSLAHTASFGGQSMLSAPKNYFYYLDEMVRFMRVAQDMLSVVPDPGFCNVFFKRFYHFLKVKSLLLKDMEAHLVDHFKMYKDDSIVVTPFGLQYVPQLEKMCDKTYVNMRIRRAALVFSHWLDCVSSAAKVLCVENQGGNMTEVGVG